MHFNVHPSVWVSWAECSSAHSHYSNLSSFPLREKKSQPKAVVVLFLLVLLLKKLSSQVVFWHCFGATDKECRGPGAGQWPGWWAQCHRNVTVLLSGPGWGLKWFGSFRGVQSRSWMSCNHGTIPGQAGCRDAPKLCPCSGASSEPVEVINWVLASAAQGPGCLLQKEQMAPLGSSCCYSYRDFPIVWLVEGCLNSNIVLF